MRNDEQKAYTIRQAAEAYGVGDDTIRRAIHAGVLRAKRSGRNDRGEGAGRYLISSEALEEWFETLPDA